LKTSSPDNTLLLTEPLLVRGMASSPDNADGMKVYYSLDNGSAALLYTFESAPGIFEQEIDLPDSEDFLGEHSVTVYVENSNGVLSKANVLNFEVVQPTLIGLEIKSLPTKVQYEQGESLDLTGLEVNASYEDGKTVLINDYTSDIPTGTKLYKTGEMLITISYLEENITKTATVTVSVQLKAIDMPSKKENGIYSVPAMVE
jgi:hypothetical protein